MQSERRLASCPRSSGLCFFLCTIKQRIQLCNFGYSDREPLREHRNYAPLVGSAEDSGFAYTAACKAFSGFTQL